MKADVRKRRIELEKLAAGMGAKAFGIADLTALSRSFPDLLSNVIGGFTRAIVCGMRLQNAALAGIADRPTPLYFHNYRQLNYQLDSLALLLADRCQDAGFAAIAVPASQIIAKDPMRGHISHKLLGWAAGIGFIGRNNLLVHPEHGACMRYVSALTDMPLEPDEPYSGEECGECRDCVAVCPAGAIRTGREDFELQACYGKLCEFTRLPFIGQHICGVCVKACAGRLRGGRAGVTSRRRRGGR